jgi:hypothetical protein
MSKRFQLLRLVLLASLAVLLVVTTHPQAPAADSKIEASNKSHPIVVTNLRNTVTNFGSFGTRFGQSVSSPTPGKSPGPVMVSKLPFPSCEWPAGSKNLYLYDGELWVGSLVSGVPRVTTGRFSGQEWAPMESFAVLTDDPAYSDEDTYTRYYDLDDLSRSIAHQPLNVQVSQRTFAWAGEDFIAHDLLVKNIGLDDLDSVYVGLCWDFDISSAAGGDYPLGDMVGLDEANLFSYMYDQDGDGGRSPGYVGGKFLDMPLAGHAWWSPDQDPETDAQRFALLRGDPMPDPLDPDNYRLLHSVGPFYLPAGRAIPILHILAIGAGLSGLRDAILEAETMVGREMTAEDDSTIATGEVHEIPVILTETKRYVGRVQMAVDWEFCEVGLTLINPLGEEITPQVAQAIPWINYTAGPHRKAYDIIEPMLGDWTLRISFISGEAPFPYHYSVLIFDVPYDFGDPMENFWVTHAYINFDDEPESCWPGFEVEGEFLYPDPVFNNDEDAVILKMGSYQETIPPGSFHGCPHHKCDCYEYVACPPGIVYMHLGIWCDEFHTFEARAEQVDMGGTENPVLVRLAIGPNTGFEKILMDAAGNEWFYDREGKTKAKTLVAEGSLPADFSLSQNYPNPFNATTQIAYSIPRETEVLLALYNVSGQQVAVLVNDQQHAGSYRVAWDGRDVLKNQVASGIYFCHLRAGELSTTRKMILLR